MNVNWVQLKGVVKELKGIRAELSRLADCWEAELAQQGYNIRPPVTDTSGPPPGVDYVDEEMAWAEENIARYKREAEESDGE